MSDCASSTCVGFAANVTVLDVPLKVSGTTMRVCGRRIAPMLGYPRLGVLRLISDCFERPVGADRLPAAIQDVTGVQARRQQNDAGHDDHVGVRDGCLDG